VAGPGHDARAFTICVGDGRARQAGDEVAPTVTIALSNIDFMRLGCGRTTSAPLLAEGALGVDGDVRAGRSILGAMNFMF